MNERHVLVLMIYSAAYLYLNTTAFAQSNLHLHDHFHSHQQELRQVVHGQERQRASLSLCEANALGPKGSWSLMVQGAGLNRLSPLAVSTCHQLGSKWAVGAGWSGGTMVGPVLRTEAALNRWIFQGGLIRLINPPEQMDSPWILGIGIRRRHLLARGLWMYGLLEYRWQHSAVTSGDLLTSAGLEWQFSTPKRLRNRHQSSKAGVSGDSQRLMKGILRWPRRGIFD